MLERVGWHEDGDWRIQWDALIEEGEIIEGDGVAEEPEEEVEEEEITEE